MKKILSLVLMALILVSGVFAYGGGGSGFVYLTSHKDLTNGNEYQRAGFRTTDHVFRVFTIGEVKSIDAYLQNTSSGTIDIYVIAPQNAKEIYSGDNLVQLLRIDSSQKIKNITVKINMTEIILNGMKTSGIIKILHLSDAGTEEVRYTTDSNGIATFTVTHLSYFAIVSGDATPKVEVIPMPTQESEVVAETNELPEETVAPEVTKIEYTESGYPSVVPTVGNTMYYVIGTLVVLAIIAGMVIGHVRKKNKQ